MPKEQGRAPRQSQARLRTRENMCRARRWRRAVRQKCSSQGTTTRVWTARRASLAHRQLMSASSPQTKRKAEADASFNARLTSPKHSRNRLDPLRRELELEKTNSLVEQPIDHGSGSEAGCDDGRQGSPLSLQDSASAVPRPPCPLCALSSITG